MRRTGTETRTRILTAAYERFYRQGFARVSMDGIAEAAAVTKRTLYQHFDSKDALLAAVLDHQRDDALRLVRRWAGEHPADATELLQSMFLGLERWAASPRWLGSGYTRLTMELADLPGHPARKVAAGHKRALEDWLAAELSRLGAAEPEGLARQVMMLMEGCMVMMLLHGDRSFAHEALRAALHLAGNRPAT